MSHQRVPYIVGNRKDIDHVYWQLNNQAGGLPNRAGDWVTTGINIDKYIKWAWRTRQWLTTGGIIKWSETFGANSIDWTWTIPNTTIDMLREDNSIVADEKGILGDFKAFPHTLANKGFYVFQKTLAAGNPTFVAHGPWTGTITIDAPSPTWGMSFTSILFDDNPSIYDTVGEAFWPNYRFQLIALVKFHSSLFPGTQFQSEDFIETGDPVHATFPTVGIGLAFDGVTIPTYDKNGLNTDFAISIDPVEYWEYRNSLGEQVYDSSTGAQINDPFA